MWGMELTIVSSDYIKTNSSRATLLNLSLINLLVHLDRASSSKLSSCLVDFTLVKRKSYRSPSWLCERIFSNCSIDFKPISLLT